MKVTPTGKWIYSQDEEYWDGSDEFSSKEEAIEAGKEYYLGESFMVGQMYSVEFTEEDFKLFDLAEDAIDCLFYSLEEEVGEASEKWCGNITNEDEQDLNKRFAKAIMEWIKERVGQPNVFQVNDIEVVMEEDKNGRC